MLITQSPPAHIYLRTRFLCITTDFDHQIVAMRLHIVGITHLNRQRILIMTEHWTGMGIGAGH